MSATIFLEHGTINYKVCWIEDPQFLLLSTIISFLVPAFMVCFLYVKILLKLQRHVSIIWGLKNRVIVWKPPNVIVGEVMTRRASKSTGISAKGWEHSPGPGTLHCRRIPTIPEFSEKNAPRQKNAPGEFIWILVPKNSPGRAFFAL